MREVLRRFVAATVVSAVAMATHMAPAEAITFGQLDGELHPNVGALLFDAGPGGFIPICSGTLIDEDVFLTAAHCLPAEPSLLDDLAVTFDTDLTDGITDAVGGTGVGHPGFQPRGKASNPFDIAVVLLDAPIAGIQPAELPALGELAGLQGRTKQTQTFTAVGYGTVREDKTGGPHALFFDPRRRYATQTALSLQKAWLTLSMNPSTGNGGTCFGDSGGPHFRGGPDSNLVVSITITGDAVCRATDKTYRVDTPWSLAFLGQFVD
jgi:hypothetical protein